MPALTAGLLARLPGSDPLGWASLAAAIIAALYWRREARQVGEGKWRRANYEDLLGPYVVWLAFLVAWMIGR